jgi:protoporphyrin/coproporphyrin ferrochelatase
LTVPPVPPVAPFDAFLLLSFGGPEGPDDVLPFLRAVTRGRGIADDRLDAVAEHYYHFDGVSPINAQNRSLMAAVAAEFDRRGIALATYWGNRNWTPLLPDTVATMARDQVQNALVLTTSATGSYSACRQYRENLADAQATVGVGAPALQKLRHYFDHPGFIEANADGIRTALASLPPALRDDAVLVFTAHSIPASMNASSGPSGGLYVAQQAETARLVAEAVRGPGARFELAWQSRSGPPSVPWLEPDINDRLVTLAADGVAAVVVSPTGFVSDHVEVLWDLDVEAAQSAERLGLRFARAATAGTHPAFVAMIADLVLEQLEGAEPRSLGRLGLCGIDCPAGCCPAPTRGPAGVAGVVSIA